MTTATRARKKPAPKWAFSSCRDLLLSVFIQCVEGDLSGLGGDPAERPAHWESIYLEYCDHAGEGRLSATMQQVKEAQGISLRIGRAAGTVELLRSFWHPTFITELKIDYPALKSLPSASDAELAAFIAKVDAYLKRDKMRLTNLQAELKPDPKKEAKKIKLDYTYFAGICLELSKFQGYRLAPEITTVLEYCLCLTRMNQHTETVNRQIEAQHGSTGNGR